MGSVQPQSNVPDNAPETVHATVRLPTGGALKLELRRQGSVYVFENDTKPVLTQVRITIVFHCCVDTPAGCFGVCTARGCPIFFALQCILFVARYDHRQLRSFHSSLTHLCLHFVVAPSQQFFPCAVFCSIHRPQLHHQSLSDALFVRVCGTHHPCSTTPSAPLVITD